MPMKASNGIDQIPQVVATSCGFFIFYTSYHAGNENIVGRFTNSEKIYIGDCRGQKAKAVNIYIGKGQ